MIILLLIALLWNTTPDVYDVYGDGIHLMVSDNGTPLNVTDDFICDWETDF